MMRNIEVVFSRTIDKINAMGHGANALGDVSRDTFTISFDDHLLGIRHGNREIRC
jgi:hypothetical protein